MSHEQTGSVELSGDALDQSVKIRHFVSIKIYEDDDSGNKAGQKPRGQDF
jgi:hypothetical protein